MTHSHDTSTPAMSAETVPSEEFVLVPKTVLAPFSEMAGELFALNFTNDMQAVCIWVEAKSLVITAGQFFALRRALAAAPNLSASHLAKEGADDEETKLENRIDNAVQAMSETHHSWEARCHAIMAALGFNFGWATPRVDEEPSPALAKGGDAVREALEEAIRYAEIGEYLYSACAYSGGDGYTEPREYGIEWQWQQSKPGEYGQGMLLAASTAWHKEQADDGTVTEAAKLRTALSTPTEGPASKTEGMGGDALHRVAAMARGYELMQRAIWNMAGTSGADASWYRNTALGITGRVDPLWKVEKLSNCSRPGDCLTQANKFVAALTPPATAEAVPPLYLIRKGGAFYRPNSQGYTRSIAEAGRYSLAEAEAITHPNGPNGPRDGMDYIPAPALASDPAPATDDRERLVEAFIAGATAVHEEIKRDHPEAVPRGDPEFYEAAQDYARAALATEASR